MDFSTSPDREVLVKHCAQVLMEVMEALLLEKANDALLRDLSSSSSFARDKFLQTFQGWLLDLKLQDSSLGEEMNDHFGCGISSEDDESIIPTSALLIDFKLSIPSTTCMPERELQKTANMIEALNVEKDTTLKSNSHTEEEENDLGVDTLATGAPKAKHFCNVCDKWFTSRRSLKCHKMRIHGTVDLQAPTKPDSVVCPNCGKSFKGQSCLDLHKLRDSCGGCAQPERVTGDGNAAEKGSHCLLCDMRFATTQSLRRHVLRIHESEGSRPFQCRTCGRCYKDRVKLERHTSEGSCSPGGCMTRTTMRRKGGNEMSDVKREVPGSLNSETIASKLEVHFEEQLDPDDSFTSLPLTDKDVVPDDGTNGDVYPDSDVDDEDEFFGTKSTCTICRIDFSTSGSKNRHVKRVHGVGKRPHQCAKCKKCFSASARLERHVCLPPIKVTKRILKGGRARRELQFSAEGASAVVALESHLGGKTEAPLLLCDSCGQKMKSLTDPFHRIRGDHEAQLKCPHCSSGQAIFPRKCLLRAHMKERHQFERRHECQFCHKRFQFKSEMERHAVIHTGEEKYVCHFCGKRFLRNANLFSHQRQHDDSMPYVCRFCHKRFKYHSAMTSHVRVHTGEKPYHCTLCTSHFRRSAHLRRHMMCHRGEKPHECNICGHRFTQKNDLKRHKDRHKNTEETVALSAIAPTIEDLPNSANVALIAGLGASTISSSLSLMDAEQLVNSRSLASALDQFPFML